MQANKLFKKLYFKLVDETDEYLIYMRKDEYDSGNDFIEFYKDVEMVQPLKHNSDDTIEPLYLSFEEITAINKQMQELGWANSSFSDFGNNK